MKGQRMKSAIRLLCCGIFLSCPRGAAAEKTPPSDSAPRHDASPIRSYVVNKKVSEFPATRDLSTPEACGATIMRDFMATGASGSEWSEISVRRTSGTERGTISPQDAAMCRESEIQEVTVYQDRLALVLSQVQLGDQLLGYDQRYLFRVNDRWLNVGHDGVAATIQEARDTFQRKCSRMYRFTLLELGECWNRPPVADPNAYLKPYVDFLREEGREPHAFVMEALKTHRLLVMGEVHNRPAYWAFNAGLARDPAFAQTVGTIYLELPSNHQESIDRFLMQDTCERGRVIRMLRDFFELGWPCQPTLEFFVAVWEVNQNLPPEQKLRIRLVDMPRPWEKIQKRQDWRAYNVDRDAFMAKNILDDLGTAEDERNGFFIVGMQHAMEKLYVDDDEPCPSAGWHLKQKLGEQLFTVFQHAPVMTNEGQTSGRLALGLIDSAFARLSDRPIAFPLTEGPFGKLPFDGMPDAKVFGTFADGYDAYVYLVPLEKEIFSPLIEGFYTQEFTPEIDRRWRLMNHACPLFPDGGVPSPEKIVRMRSEFWGQPRDWTSSLGPENAWHYGDQWQTVLSREHYRGVTRQELIAELDKIYRGLRAMNPEEYSYRSWEKACGFDYLTETDWPRMYQWWCDATKKHPFESAVYGELTRNKGGLPQIEVTTTLQGGIRFSKVFTFQYQAAAQHWQAQFGLDMHLDPRWRDFPGTKNEPLR